MKRSTSAIALIAGLMMSLFGAVAHAATCPPASGYTTPSMESHDSTFDNTWVELSEHI